MYKVTYLLVPLNQEYKKLFSKLNLLKRKKKVKEDINKTCRICNTKQDESNLSSLYDSNKYFPSITIATAINECFDVTLHQNDKLSSFICSKCASNTVDAYDFKNTIVNTEKMLETKIKTMVNLKKKKKKLHHTQLNSDMVNQNTSTSISSDHNYSKELMPNAKIKETDVVEPIKDNEMKQYYVIKQPDLPDEIPPTDDTVVKDSIRPIADTLEKWWIRSNGPPYTCKICGCHYGMHYKAFYTHVRSHLVSKKPCIHCGKRFMYHKLIIHMRTHTKERPYVCDQCPARFTTPGNLKRHMLFHTGEKPYVCDFCGKGFTQKSAMETHRQIHLGTTQFICELCGKTFISRSYYGKHKLKDHTELNPDINANESSVNVDETYKCSECYRVFSKLQSLNQHYRIHDRANFKCETCSTVVHSSFSYDVHMYLHEVQTWSCKSEFDCKFCTSTYSDKNDLEVHLLNHIAKPYSCKHCMESFDNKMSLNLHLRKHCEGRPFPCTYCKKSFKSATSLIQHTRIHTGNKPYLCQICLRSFTQQQQLSTHMLTHTGEKKYVCQYCGKAFAVKGNLTVHIRRHTGTTPFYCDICGKGFYDSSSRRKHMKWKHHGENLETDVNVVR